MSHVGHSRTIASATHHARHSLLPTAWMPRIRHHRGECEAPRRSGGLNMIMLTEISLTCPVCDNEFTSTAIRDRHGATKTRTDFQEYVAGNTVVPYTIHQCPRCGYAAMPEGF